MLPAEERHGACGCGEATVAPWQPAVLMHDTPDEPPPKFAGGVVPVPWHALQ